MDNASPLKYTAFLSAASGNHQTAMQNAINALYATAGTYRKYLDLEGAKITLTAPVTFPKAAGAVTRYITGGEIEAAATFTGGNHMFVHNGAMGNPDLRWTNITMDGNGVASWVTWDNGNMFFLNCDMRNSKKATAPATGPAGIDCTGGTNAGMWVDYCWMSCGDQGHMAPSSRTQVAMHSASGDQKVLNTTAAFFKHTLIYDSDALMCDGCHFFQGQTRVATMTDHTASIKFTEGYFGNIINNLYLGKSFVELSNETNPGASSIGGLTINGMRAYADSAQADFAFLVARDYSGVGGKVLRDISITGALFINRGTVNARPTRLFDATSFDRTSFDGITMRNNAFEARVLPQGNPVTVNQFFSDVGTAGATIDFTDKMAFDALPYAVTALTPQAKSGGSGGAFTNAVVGNIDREANSVRIDFAAEWSGNVLCTVTGNVESGRATFIDG